MSLAGQITDTITAIASTRDARAQALGSIRRDTARFLKDARSTRHRVSAAQKKALAESARSTKLATAITLGAADEQIDSYRKARHRQADLLAAELADAARTLRKETAGWLGATFAERRQKALGDQRDRNQALAALRKDVGELRAAHAAFVESLAEDRQAASQLWQDRTRKVTRRTAAPAGPQAFRSEPVDPEAGSETAGPEASAVPHPVAEKAEASPATSHASSHAAPAAPVKPETDRTDAGKSEGGKPESGTAEPVKAEAVKPEARPAKAAKGEDGKSDGGKSDGGKSDGIKADALRGDGAKGDASKADASKADDGKAAVTPP